MNQLGTVYATKRRRRNGKSLKPPPKDGVTKSNPSKRHRERLNAELDTLASLLPFEQNILSKLDRLSILRLSVSYLRTKSYFQVVMHKDKEDGLHHEPGAFRNRELAAYDHALLDGEMFLQALNGFLLILTCEGEVFFATHSIESYLGFHQSDIVHQSVYELVHSEDREELQRQLMWNSFLAPEGAGLALQDVLRPDHAHLLERSFTVRFRCLLDNTSGFLRLDIRGRVKVLHGQNRKTEEPPLALFAICTPFGPPSLLEIPQKEVMFKSKHKLDLALVSMDQRGKLLLGYSDAELANLGGYDLVHYDDLAYVASAHQELLKTGASGMIAYRFQTKEGGWQWLQTSSRLVYKNSKPDFVISTHRPLMEEEGRDLLGKRTMDFKVSYLDAGLTNSYFADSDPLVMGSSPLHHSSSSPSGGSSGGGGGGGGGGGSAGGAGTPQRVNRRYKTQLRDFLSTCRTKRKLAAAAAHGRRRLHLRRHVRHLERGGGRRRRRLQHVLHAVRQLGRLGGARLGQRALLLHGPLRQQLPPVAVPCRRARQPVPGGHHRELVPPVQAAGHVLLGLPPRGRQHAVREQRLPGDVPARDHLRPAHLRHRRHRRHLPPPHAPPADQQKRRQAVLVPAVAGHVGRQQVRHRGGQLARVRGDDGAGVGQVPGRVGALFGVAVRRHHPAAGDVGVARPRREGQRRTQIRIHQTLSVHGRPVVQLCRIVPRGGRRRRRRQRPRHAQAGGHQDGGGADAGVGQSSGPPPLQPPHGQPGHDAAPLRGVARVVGGGRAAADGADVGQRRHHHAQPLGRAQPHAARPRRQGAGQRRLRQPQEVRQPAGARPAQVAGRDELAGARGAVGGGGAVGVHGRRHRHHQRRVGVQVGGRRRGGGQVRGARPRPAPRLPAPAPARRQPRQPGRQGPGVPAAAAAAAAAASPRTRDPPLGVPPARPAPTAPPRLPPPPAPGRGLRRRRRLGVALDYFLLERRRGPRPQRGMELRPPPSSVPPPVLSLHHSVSPPSTPQHPSQRHRLSADKPDRSPLLSISEVTNTLLNHE